MSARHRTRSAHTPGSLAKGQSVTLVDGDTAYGAARSMFVDYGAGNLAGPVTGGLYSYYNSAYGQIQPDGTVKLTYQGTPVWLFTGPLIPAVLRDVLRLRLGYRTASRRRAPDHEAGL